MLETAAGRRVGWPLLFQAARRASARARQEGRFPMPDPIESQRRRKRALKRGSARDFFCPQIREQVLIAVRRRPGAWNWQDTFVWCSQAECQHNGSNMPPCPLSPGVLTSADTLSPCLARCALCQLPVTRDHAGIVALADGRLQHSRCPYPVCVSCAQPILPDHVSQPDRNGLIHRRCATTQPRPIAGGAAMLPWTAIFEGRFAARAHPDGQVLAELHALTHEVVTHTADIRAWARHVRSTTALLRRGAA
jgi:hypothetical protein